MGAQWIVYAVVTAFVFLAAIAGDSVGYEVGKHVGPSVLNHRILATRRAQLDKAQAFLRERGGSAIFLGRWTAFFRAVMPALAGASRVPYRRFLPWNTIGGITWGVVVVIIGYIAGAGFEHAASVFGGGSALVIGVVAVGGLLVFRQRRDRARREAT
ncbi:MAG: DedA family protein [Nostocoides sp.]